MIGINSLIFSIINFSFYYYLLGKLRFYLSIWNYFLNSNVQNCYVRCIALDINLLSSGNIHPLCSYQLWRAIVTVPTGSFFSFPLLACFWHECQGLVWQMFFVNLPKLSESLRCSYSLKSVCWEQEKKSSDINTCSER